MAVEIFSGGAAVILFGAKRKTVFPEMMFGDTWQNAAAVAKNIQHNKNIFLRIIYKREWL